MLTGNEELVLKNNETLGKNEYLGTIAEDLDLHYWKDNSVLLSNTKCFDRIDNIIKKYKNHLSIKTTKSNCKGLVLFLSE